MPWNKTQRKTIVNKGISTQQTIIKHVTDNNKTNMIIIVITKPRCDVRDEIKPKALTLTNKTDFLTNF